MNVNYATASNPAVENVFWPAGQAPRGEYQIYVNHFQNFGQPDCQDPTPFTVRVVIRGQTQHFHGEVVNNDPNRRKVLVYQFTLD